MTAMSHEPVGSRDRQPSVSGRDDQARAPALTSLIRRLGGSQADRDGADLDALIASLRAVAARQLRSQRPSHTLQPTALVNEAFLRMFGKGPKDFVDRHHFFKTAAAAMRTAIVDHERRRRVAGRAVEFHAELHEEGGCEEIDMVLLDDCLSRLQRIDPGMAQLVELRVFSQCTEKEAAAVMQKKLRTVQRDWAFARGWLRREFKRS